MWDLTRGFVLLCLSVSHKSGPVLRVILIERVGWMDGDDRSLNGVAYCYVKGLPYMTSAVGGGRVSPKSRGKKQNQLICDSDKGGRGSKSQKILRTSYMEAPLCISLANCPRSSRI